MPQQPNSKQLPLDLFIWNHFRNIQAAIPEIVYPDLQTIVEGIIEQAQAVAECGLVTKAFAPRINKWFEAHPLPDNHRQVLIDLMNVFFTCVIPGRMMGTEKEEEFIESQYVMFFLTPSDNPKAVVDPDNLFLAYVTMEIATATVSVLSDEAKRTHLDEVCSKMMNKARKRAEKPPERPKAATGCLTCVLLTTSIVFALDYFFG